MRISNLVTATAISAVCFLLPLGAQEPQLAGPQSSMNSPLFHNPFASQTQAQPAPKMRITPSAKTPVLQTKPQVCAIPLLSVAPKDAAHYTMPMASQRQDVDPGAHLPSIPVCGAGKPQK
jgi:hypothetical protein